MSPAFAPPEPSPPAREVPHRIGLWATLAIIALAMMAAATSAQPSLVLREAVFAYDIADLQDVAGMEQATSRDQVVYLGEVLLELAPADVLDLSTDIEPRVGGAVVYLSLAPDAAKVFSTLTESRIGEAIAIVQGGRLLSAPVVQTRIDDGRLQITGLASVEEAEALVEAFVASGPTVDPTTRQLDRMAALRQRVDRSTPRGAAEALIEAVRLTDPLVLAEALHPDVLAEARRQLDEPLSAFLQQLPQIGPDERRQLERAVAVDALPDSREGYSDEQVVALALVFGWDASEVDASDSSSDILELAPPVLPAIADLLTLRELPRIALAEEVGPGTAYVIVEPDAAPGMTDGGMSAARVLSFQRVDGAWRLKVSTWNAP